MRTLHNIMFISYSNNVSNVLIIIITIIIRILCFFLRDTYSGAYATRHTLTLQSELCGHLHFQIGHDRVQRQSPRPPTPPKLFAQHCSLQ